MLLVIFRQKSLERKNREGIMGEKCPECGFVDGHNCDACPLVLSGQVKAMPGLSPEAVERIKAAERQRSS